MNNIIILIFCDTFCVLWDFVHYPEAYSYTELYPVRRKTMHHRGTLS